MVQEPSENRDIKPVVLESYCPRQTSSEDMVINEALYGGNRPENIFSKHSCAGEVLPGGSDPRKMSSENRHSESAKSELNKRS